MIQVARDYDAFVDHTTVQGTPKRVCNSPCLAALYVVGGVHVTLLPGTAVGSTGDNRLQFLCADLTSQSRRRVGPENEPRGRAARCGLHLQTQTALSGGPAEMPSCCSASPCALQTLCHPHLHISNGAI